MKEEIEKQALEYTNKMDSRLHDPMEISCAEAGFIHGAEWMLEQYQGITPDTVKEMLEALERIKTWEMPDTGKTWDDGTKMSYVAAYGTNGERDVIKDIARCAIAKAEQELNQG